MTLPAQFGYDQTSLTIGGQQETPTNTIGRLSSDCILYSNSCGGGTMTGKSYDPMGRFALIWQEPPGSSYLEHFSYTYDLNGNEYSRALSSMPYSATFNGAGRMQSFSQTAWTDSYNPANLLSGELYDPFGHLVFANYANGLSESWSYDKRGRVQAAAVGTNCSNGTCSGTTVYSFSLNYAPNSNILSANDLVNQNWNYSYDQLNRLACASVSSNTACAFPPTGTPTYTYVYDRFGNRWQQNSPAGSIYTSSLTFTGNGTTNNNRMDGYCYDSAGNLLDAGACPSSGPHQYVYDAENRLISSNYGASTYTYNAEGERITKTTGGVTMTYTYDRDGHLFETYGQTNSLMENYVDGRHLGSYDWNSNDTGTIYHYTHADWLGTERARIDVSGNVCETITSLPFGDGMTTSGSCSDTSNLHFTGKERDSESGLDNFGARYDASNFGRFMSPDPYNSIIVRQGMKAGGLPEAAARAFFNGFLESPQNWNKYIYALNNPLRFVDPTGAAPQGHHLFVERAKVVTDALGRNFMESIRTGPLSGNGYPNQPGFNEPHFEYNEAVKEMVNEAMEKNGPTDNWTVQQWKDLANEILNSDEPAIKEFLDELEENNPGARAALAAAIAGYRPSAWVIARIGLSAAAARARGLFHILILCVNCHRYKEVVTWRFLPPA